MKNIIVTGASQGIGYATVLKLAQSKENNIFAISRNIENLTILKKKCLDLFGNTITIVEYDLKELLKSGKVLASKLIPDLQKVDVLINNAGLLKSCSFEEQSPLLAKAIFDINYFAPAELIRILLPLLKKSESAHVVNISSMAGFQGSLKFPGLTHYSASKSAIACLTECLAEEFSKTSISFNALALGAVQTEMLNNAFPGYQAPLSASQMAGYIADFAMNQNQYINGKILPISLSSPE